MSKVIGFEGNVNGGTCFAIDWKKTKSLSNKFTFLSQLIFGTTKLCDVIARCFVTVFFTVYFTAPYTQCHRGEEGD